MGRAAQRVRIAISIEKAAARLGGEIAVDIEAGG